LAAYRSRHTLNSSHRIWLGELGTRRPAKSKKEKELAKINDGEETGGLK